MSGNEHSTARDFDPDDAPDLAAAGWPEKFAQATVRRGRPPSANPKVSTTIRLSRDVIDHFKAGAVAGRRGSTTPCASGSGSMMPLDPQHVRVAQAKSSASAMNAGSAKADRRAQPAGRRRPPSQEHRCRLRTHRRHRQPARQSGRRWPAALFAFESARMGHSTTLLTRGGWERQELRMKDVIALLNDQRSELLESLFSGFRAGVKVLTCTNFGTVA